MKIRCFDCERSDWLVRFHHTNNRSFCDNCYQKRLQPERSKREDLEEGFFPPPWNFYEHPEKTEGWIEFQRSMRKDPEYYLQGCGALNTMET